MNPVLESARVALERRDERRAAAVTALLFVVLAVAGWFITFFEVPDPPLGTQFVSVGLADFGMDPSAGGTDESKNPSSTVDSDRAPADASTSSTASTAASGAVTQSESEVAVRTSTSPNPSSTTGDARRVNDRLAQRLGALSSPGGGGSDGRTQGTGNEGNPLGKIDGSGVIRGDGFEAGLDGGELVGRPRLEEDPTRSGTIRLDIVVDAAGKVKEARFNRSGSTFSDARHIELARKAAFTASFTPNPGKVRRHGWINIRFELE
jgi:hypothetical protein